METESFLASSAAPPSLTEGDIHAYSSSDLALCSTDEARRLLSYESAVKLRVLPMALVASSRGSVLHCAVVNQSDELRRSLHFLTEREVRFSLVSDDILDEAIVRAYLGCDERLRVDLERLAHTTRQPERAKMLELPEARGDAARFLSTLMEFAVARGASDLHLCPGPDGAFIRLRIDGELLSQEEQRYPGSLHEQIVSRLKVMAGLDIACKRLPQDGAFTFRVGAATKCVRLSTLPSVDGESVVLRFLYSRRLPRLAALGLEPTSLALVRSAMTRTNGVILLTGPTGSGKTTTMYSLALELQNQGRNVVSVEDPVESPIPGMVQVQVHEPQGLDYPRAIRSVLRHDPDVILIGEMRDPLSARIALTSASTGHLTVSSLHMGSVLQVLERFRSFDIPSHESAQSIVLILNQRLLPKLCGRCKIADVSVGVRFGRALYRASGCSACHGTGFDGRVLLTEALDLRSYQVKDVYGKARSSSEVLSALPSGALISWTTSLEYHLLRGDISVEQFEAFIDEEMTME